RSKGYLVCPGIYPFASDALTKPDSIYHLTSPYSYAGRKYLFVVKYSTAQESYNLGYVDIERESERVWVNGELWTRGTHYNINYETGDVTFVRALPADADIRITFEYRPLFTTSDRTLVGTRAEWKFLGGGKLGSSVFFRTEETRDDKPILGAEPFRRAVAEADMSYDLKSTAAAALLDRLPLVRADAPVTLRLGGEGAISLADPNTRGAAYLDDFEGTTITQKLILANRSWGFASVPVGKTIGEFATRRMRYFVPKAQIPLESIFGKGIGTQANDRTEIFRVVFEPDNLSSWAGIMGNPRMNLNIADLENIEAVFRTSAGQGKIHITVGTSIDEDAPRRRPDGSIAGLNGLEDTEDKNHNGVLDKIEGEDSGIDGVPGADNAWSPSSEDDGNDDYDKDNNPNGTEGNGGNPDGEDLIGSGWMRNNDYFEYCADLNDTLVVRDLVNGWKTLRIPLHSIERRTQVGSPRLEDVRLVRVWFDGFARPDSIDFYSLGFVGSRWGDPKVVKGVASAEPVDSLERASVSVISNQTDIDYLPPFEPRKDQQGNTKLEASLRFRYENLRPGHRAMVRKASLVRDDYRDYRMIRVYVHRDENDPDFVLQLGSDSANYYEYRRPISSAQPVVGRSGWYEFFIALDTLPRLKFLHGTRSDSVIRLTGYAISGNPSLADVRYLAMGLENTASQPLTGTVWIGDIRIVQPRKDPGLALNSQVALGLSDLATLNVSYRYDDPNFRRFSEARGVKTGGFREGLGLGMSARLDRFLPAGWGVSAPLSYDIRRASVVPKFASDYGDLRLPKERIPEETGSEAAESWSLSLSKSKSKQALLAYTLDALSYSFRQARASSYGLLDRSSASSFSHSLGYGASPRLGFRVGETEVSYFPSSIRLSGRYAQSKSPAWHRSSDTSAWSATRNDSSLSAGYDLGLDYSPVSDLSFNYSLGADHDLTDARYLGRFNIGQEAGRESDFGAAYSFELGEIASPRIDFDAHYEEDRARSMGRYSERRNVSNSGDIDLSTDLNLPDILAWLGQRRDKRHDATAQAGTPQWLLMQLERTQDYLSPVDINYSYTRTSSFADVSLRPPVLYQIGLNNGFWGDSLASSTNQDISSDFGASTDLRIKRLDARLRYGRNWSRDLTGTSPTGSIGTDWPDVSVSISSVEAIARKYLASSSVSSGLRIHTDQSGNYSGQADTFDLVNRRLSRQISFSPLLSWQATWKNRMNTTFATNWTRSASSTNYDVQRASTISNESRNYNLNLSYSFSAPGGIKLPMLKRVKFTSDLSVNLGLSGGASRAQTKSLSGELVTTDNSEDYGTSLALSYRYSRSIE
ncbi:MAG: hypothetical protein ABIK62_02705, partial [candidate division WOR-3 bacterium]